MRFSYLLQVNLAILMLAFVFSSNAWAIKIEKANDKAALVLLESSANVARVGDKLTIMDSGQRIGVLQITQISNGRAKAVILSGKAPVGANVIVIIRGEGSTALKKTGNKYGLIFGYGMDSQTATLTSLDGTVSDSVGMTGAGYALKFAADLHLKGKFSLLGRVGIDTLNLSGNSPHALCIGSLTACSSQITYLTVDGIIKYAIPIGASDIYFGAGGGTYYPLSKSSNVLTAVNMITPLFIDLGLDISIGKGRFMPLGAEYVYYPGSSAVKTSALVIVLGYLW